VSFIKKTTCWDHARGRNLPNEDKKNKKTLEKMDVDNRKRKGVSSNSTIFSIS
jgi:hypothetical protein